MKERIPVQTSLLWIANKAKSDQITLVLLRKRVFTKSPVRENRTPGSVRGLLGNWQSYRDQLAFDTNSGNTHFLRAVIKHELAIAPFRLGVRVVRFSIASCDSLTALVCVFGVNGETRDSGM